MTGYSWDILKHQWCLLAIVGSVYILLTEGAMGHRIGRAVVEPYDRNTNNWSDVLNMMLENYDMRIRPNANGPPVKVDYDMFIVSGFDSITTSMQDFNIMAFIRQYWNDPRLTFNLSAEYNSKPNHALDSSFSVNQKLLERIWVPDMYIINEKAGVLHDLTVENKALRIYPNGDVFYSIRLSLVLACNMNLRKYPMDSQVCHLEMESYGYRVHDVQFKWKGDNAVVLNSAIEIPEFILHDIQLTNDTNIYNTGNFTCLRAYFFLKRIFDFHLIQTYIPSILLVVVSWVSFWINPEASPARVGLGITTVLTMTAQSTGVRETLPPVAYIKAIDVWMTTCLAFVFAALVEFALVNYVLTEQRQKATKKEWKKSMRADNGNGNADVPLQALSKNSLHTEGSGCEDQMQGTFPLQPAFVMIHSRITPRLIDRISRIIFPFSFLLFNMIYWPMCFYGYGDETIPKHT